MIGSFATAARWFRLSTVPLLLALSMLAGLMGGTDAVAGTNDFSPTTALKRSRRRPA